MKKHKNTKFRDIEPNSDHQKWEEFKESCEGGNFIDYDGYGEFATDKQVSNISVLPSEANDPQFEKPNWATHVVWYNR
jgi:hypothetical protein